MVWIQFEVEGSLLVRSKRAEVFELIRDVPRSGKFFPGVERIEDLGDRRFRWVLAERRALGSSFKGEYINAYADNGTDEMSWQPVSGNMKTRGCWRISGPDDAVRVSLVITTELDAPVPRLLKKPAELFGEHETGTGLHKQLETLKRTLEVRAEKL